MENRYIVVAVKSWNKDVFDNIISKYEGEWLFVDKKEDLTYQKIQDFSPEFIFFPHWNWIVPAEIVNDNSWQCIGFHETDLPFGRGGSPIQNLIIRGHKSTKISAFKMIEGLDEGPIYLKETLSLFGKAQEIFIRASIIIAGMIKRIIDERIIPLEQEGEVVIFSRRTEKDNEIQGDKISIKDVYNMIRMLDAEGYPSAFLTSNNLKLEFSDAEWIDNELIAKVKIKKTEEKQI